MKLLLLGSTESQEAARCDALPPDARTHLVSDPYSAAVALVKGGWDALLLDPDFLSALTLTLIEGAIGHCSLKVLMFEMATPTALYQQALRAGAVPVAVPQRVARTKLNGPESRAKPMNSNGPANAALGTGPEVPELIGALQTLAPEVMTDEEAILAALGYGEAEHAAAMHVKKKFAPAKPRMPDAEMSEAFESQADHPVLTDAELRALLGEDEN